MKVVDLFFTLAKEHIAIKSFVYNSSSKKGAGNNQYPLVWLDDPYTGGKAVNTIRYTVNVDILGLPATEAEVIAVQDACFEVGLAFAEKVKQSYIGTGFQIEGYNFISLRDYFDDNAAGFRFTYTAVQTNPVSRCLTDFNPDKEFTNNKTLPVFSTAAADGCAVFTDKVTLPNFDV